MYSTAKGFNIPYSKYWVGVPPPCMRGRSSSRVIDCQEARGSCRAEPVFYSFFLGAPCALAMLGRIRFTARFLNRHCCPRSVFIFGRAPGHKKVVRDTRRRCALPLQCPNMSIPRPSMDKSTLSPRQRTRKNRRFMRRLSKKSQKTIDGLTTIYCVYFRKIIE